MLKKFEKFLLKSGITERQLSKLSLKIELAGDLLKEIIEEMIKDIEVHEYRDVVEIYYLIPESQWEMYVIHEFEELREQLLLKEALKRLRKAFRGVLNVKIRKEENTPIAS